MIGWRTEPPGDGSPFRRACSLSNCVRRPVSERGRYGPGSARTSTRLRLTLTAIRPKPIATKTMHTRIPIAAASGGRQG